MILSDDVRDIFRIFHDGTITRLEIENDICDIDVEIQYIAKRVDPNFTAFRVKLSSFRSFCFIPWEEPGASPAAVISNPDEITKAQLGILSAEMDDMKIKVMCVQDIHRHLGYRGGLLTFECSHAELFDEAGRPVGMDTLKQIATDYWDAFSPPQPRRATPDDIPSVAALHRLAFFHAMPHMPVLHTPEDDLAFYSTVVFPTAQVWLCERDGETAGFIAFRPGWVDHLYIHPDHQRRGIGSALLAVARSVEEHLHLWTFQCNLPAHRFYEGHGFQIERMTDGATHEERQPDILYRWSRPSQAMTPAIFFGNGPINFQREA